MARVAARVQDGHRCGRKRVAVLRRFAGKLRKVPVEPHTAVIEQGTAATVNESLTVPNDIHFEAVVPSPFPMMRSQLRADQIPR